MSLYERDLINCTYFVPMYQFDGEGGMTGYEKYVCDFQASLWMKSTKEKIVANEKYYSTLYYVTVPLEEGAPYLKVGDYFNCPFTKEVFCVVSVPVFGPSASNINFYRFEAEIRVPFKDEDETEEPA